MSKASKRNAGRRIRVGPISHYGKSVIGLEGTLIEKTSDPAWPFVITLDNGMELRLDDWQFEFIGTAVETLQPPRVIPKPERVTSEVIEMATKGTTKRERVAPKGKASKPAPEVARRQRSAKGGVAKSANARKRVALDTAPTKGKAAARTTAKEAPAKRGPAKSSSGKTWPELIFEAMGGKRIVLSGDDGFYAKHEGRLAKLFSKTNTNIQATIRRTLQQLREEKKVRNVRPGVWEPVKGKA